LTLPTFLGIGVPRAGTTWLYELLARHPDVYVPPQRKEVHFFDRYYERGIRWYERFFPPVAQSGQYTAIGEITPSYLYCMQCPERIAGISSVERLILMLRNPVDRAYSHYQFRRRIDNFSGTFEDFLQSHPHAIEWGFYSRFLKNYLRYFSERQILVLIHEHAFADTARTKVELAHFLAVDPRRFAKSAEAKVNRGYMPSLRRAYALSISMARHLREKDLYRIINLAKRLGVRRVFGERHSIAPSMEAKTQYLGSLYSGEISELETLLRIDLDCWQ
jgi:hypothetical protein